MTSEEEVDDESWEVVKGNGDYGASLSEVSSMSNNQQKSSLGIKNIISL